MATVPLSSSNDQYPMSPRLLGGNVMVAAETREKDTRKSIVETILRKHRKKSSLV